MAIQGKLHIELKYPGDGRLFLNYWGGTTGGEDICCQVVDGKLLKSNFDEDGNDLPDTEIDFNDFLSLIEATSQDIETVD